MTKSLEGQLDLLLQSSVSELARLHRARFRKIAGALGDNFILCGSGCLGQKVLDGLRKAGVEPLAFCDNNPSLWSTAVNGLQVLSPEEAAARYADTAIFVITVYTAGPLQRQIRGMGVRTVPFPLLAWAYPEALLPHGAVDLPHLIFQEADEVRKGLSLWADEESRCEYVAQIKWRMDLDSDDLPAHLPPEQTYFPVDLVPLGRRDVFVDCGAFDGDSIRSFMRLSGLAFEGAVGLEPDPWNFGRLQSYIDSLDEPVRQKVEALNCAVGARAQKVRFNATGTAGSSAGMGDFEVECLPLDEALRERRVSYLKMDIEGAEYDALLGGRRLISSQEPVLAICLYHRMSDIWKIPLLIRSFSDNYRLFLRRYCDDCWEQICYAVPTERLETQRASGENG